MQAETAIAILKRHELELRQLGIESLFLFGSTARGEATSNSDVDVAVKLTDIPSGLAIFGRLDRIRERLTDLLSKRVDVILEPSRPGRMKSAIERDRRRAF